MKSVIFQEVKMDCLYIFSQLITENAENNLLSQEGRFHQCKAKRFREENLGSSRLLLWCMVQNIAPSQLAHEDPQR